ncbi:NAD(P)/FAD-dependent oxidoreductase [Paraburkholderia unamae]|uniref:NAD(P)/FAD-dependent oxidoreductase n=1 Tax=Paraburkholderia unamae TaxID=219649 RepID=UPI00209690F8|nr:FAD-binding oxidoreductase [Paraburkholderia unamae]
MGAGIAGLAAALELAERGVPVCVLEKGEVGGEQSNYAMGWIRSTGRPVEEIPLSLLNRLCLDARLPAARGEHDGVLFCASGDAQRARLESWAHSAAPFGVKTRFLDGAQAAACLPGCSAPIAGGLFTDVDTSVDPRRLMQALVARAAELNVEIRTQCAVRALDFGAGAVRGVVTERGVERAAGVVLATGAWTRLMLRGGRYTLPCVKVRSSLARVRVGAHGAAREIRSNAALARCAAVADVGFRALGDGTFVVGLANNSRLEMTPDALRFAPRYLRMWWAHRGEITPSLGRRFIDELRFEGVRNDQRESAYERERAMRPKPGRALTELAASRFAALFPALGPVQAIDSWAGYLDMTPDALPVISSVPHTPGLFVIAGLCGSGLGTALGAGRVIASLVTGASADIDTRPFRLERFSWEASQSWK